VISAPPKTSKSIWKRIPTFVTVLALVFVVYRSWTVFHVPFDIGPNLNLLNEHREPTSLTSLKGKVVLVDFWASWCQPCVFTVPKLQSLHERFKDRGLVVLGVNMDEEPATIAAAVTKHGMTYSQWTPQTSGWDDPAVMTYVSQGSIPTIYLLDASGSVRLSLQGLPPLFIPLGFWLLERQIDSLLPH